MKKNEISKSKPHPMQGNKNAVGGAGNWHLKKYKTEEELISRLDTYFVEENLPFTITGLALHLDISSKQTLYVYKKDPVLGGLMEKALTIVERGYETKLFDVNPRGSIFALQSMGWGTNSTQNITVQDIRIDLSDPDETIDITFDEDDNLFD